MTMNRLATVAITPETVAFVLRDITGELFSYEFSRSKYNSVLDVLRDVARPRGSVDYIFVNADWLNAPLGKHIRDIDWTLFCMDEVPRHVGETVELTTNAPDAAMAMLRIVQDELTAATRSSILS